MSATWKRQKQKYYHGTSGWDLLIDNVRVGCVVQNVDPPYCQLIFRGKRYHKMYPTMSGARLRLEQLAGVETPWARERRSKMVYLTPEEKMWAILNS